MYFKFELISKRLLNKLIGILTIFLSVHTTNSLAVDNVSPYSNIAISELIESYIANKNYNSQTNLCSIMTSHGSDKGGYHNYTTLYSRLFEDYRHEKLNVFELGLGTNNVDVPSNMGPAGKPGASLYGWAEYFPNSDIYGADIDDRILFQYGNISTFYCDQRDAKSIEAMFSNNFLNGMSFDIIIEDGLHEFEANLTFLKNSIIHLKEGGIYITEDLLPSTTSKFKELLPELRKEYKYVEIVKIPTDIPGLKYWDDNTLLIIQK